MARKRKKATKHNRPLKITMINAVPNFAGTLAFIEYICDGIPKLLPVSYMKISENVTIWELRDIIRWAEKYHPSRIRIVGSLEYVKFFSGSDGHCPIDPKDLELDGYIPDKQFQEIIRNLELNKQIFQSIATASQEKRKAKELTSPSYPFIVKQKRGRK